jgi:hypothetical protein
MGLVEEELAHSGATELVQLTHQVIERVTWFSALHEERLLGVLNNLWLAFFKQLATLVRFGLFVNTQRLGSDTEFSR